MAENKEHILAVRDLDITFKTTAGPVHAIRGVNIDLYRGETVALVGESGSGKSVTMKAAMGILAQNAVVNSGSIEFSYHHEDGTPETVDILTKDKKWIRRHINGKRIAMVFQDPMTSLDPTMTIGKQIMEGMLWHFKMPKAEAYKKALELLDKAPSVKEQVRADGLLLGNRCLIYIQMNQLDKAADCLTRLEAMVKADKNNALGGDVVQSARCLRIRLNASKGWATDVAWVKAVAASGQPPFYAASNQLMLGQVLLADHNKAGAKAALEKAAGYSTNLWACRRAAELLAGLEASASKEI